MKKISSRIIKALLHKKNKAQRVARIAENGKASATGCGCD